MGVFEPVDVADVRMVERRQHLRFTAQARESIGIGGERVRQNLQRDVAIELGIPRAVDLAHAARANERQDFVYAETGAGCEGHSGARLSHARTVRRRIPECWSPRSGTSTYHFLSLGLWRGAVLGLTATRVAVNPESV